MGRSPRTDGAPRATHAEHAADLAALIEAFMAMTMHEGPLTEEVVRGLAEVDPAAMGLPAEDDGSRDDALLGQNLVTCSPHPLDLQALAAAGTHGVRLVVAGGRDSGEQLAVRSARGLARELGLPLAGLPGHHAGFVPQEWGMGSDPEAFARELVALLGDAGPSGGGV